jgi:hypothetical protein
MADTQTAHAQESSGLKRAVTPAMLLLFVVGDMVGGGIYALVGEVGGRVGGALWSGFALALLLALFTAGSYAAHPGAELDPGDRRDRVRRAAPQREAEIWLRAGILLVVGLVLYAVNVAVTRRESR